MRGFTGFCVSRKLLGKLYVGRSPSIVLKTTEPQYTSHLMVSPISPKRFTTDTRFTVEQGKLQVQASHRPGFHCFRRHTTANPSKGRNVKSERERDLLGNDAAPFPAH